ncbi:hypothetical protein BDN67DRAFT_126186 [Paxillus ammoniavirescens]|nr:hypothetical protein BDN67DRAFT_126186 [Paxillus ammoniavirescens]
MASWDDIQHLGHGCHETRAWRRDSLASRSTHNSPNSRTDQGKAWTYAPANLACVGNRSFRSVRVRNHIVYLTLSLCMSYSLLNCLTELRQTRLLCYNSPCVVPNLNSNSPVSRPYYKAIRQSCKARFENSDKLLIFPIEHPTVVRVPCT